MEENILDRISQVVKWLKKEKIEHVLVGGAALNLWGGQVATFDVDIAIPLFSEKIEDASIANITITAALPEVMCLISVL